MLIFFAYLPASIFGGETGEEGDFPSLGRRGTLPVVVDGMEGA